MLEFCETNRITLTAFAPLGSPNRKTCDPSTYWPEGEPLKDSCVLELSEKYKKSAAQVSWWFA